MNSDGVGNKMRLWVFLVLVAVVAGKGKKHRHHKPGKFFTDRSAFIQVVRKIPFNRKGFNGSFLYFHTN